MQEQHKNYQSHLPYLPVHYGPMEYHPSGHQYSLLMVGYICFGCMDIMVDTNCSDQGQEPTPSPLLGDSDSTKPLHLPKYHTLLALHHCSHIGHLQLHP